MPTITNQHGDKITVSDKIVLHACPTCFIVHGMLEDRGVRGKSCHCPNGHSWYFTGKSELDSTKEALERERRIAANRLVRLEAERRNTERERRSHAATKGHQTRLKKRIAGGACPCCNRTFVNLERHMSGQHPDFVKADNGAA
jgi:ssDNA-binding Zn-finger/Zn-ribbon topoisomerase 1